MAPSAGGGEGAVGDGGVHLVLLEAGQVQRAYAPRVWTASVISPFLGARR